MPPRKSRVTSRAERRRIAGAVMGHVRPVEIRYAKSLRGVVKAIHREYEKRLLPRLEELPHRQDAFNPLADVFDVVGAIVHAAIPRTVGPLFDKMSGAVRNANKK